MKGNNLNHYLPIHETQQGLRVSQRYECTRHIATLSCQFYKLFGQKEKPGRKRKSYQFFKTWVSGKFNTNLYVHHHQNEHQYKWVKYQQIPIVQKQQLLKGFVPFLNTMAWYFDRESHIQYCGFDQNLINFIIKYLLFGLYGDNALYSGSYIDC